MPVWLFSAGARFGYTRWAMINLVRDYRAGKLELFAPQRAPAPARSPSGSNAVPSHPPSAKQTSPPPTPVPRWNGRTIRYEIG